MQKSKIILVAIIVTMIIILRDNCLATVQSRPRSIITC